MYFLIHYSLWLLLPKCSLILISFAGKGCGIQWAQDNVWIVYLAMYFRNVQLLIAFTG